MSFWNLSDDTAATDTGKEYDGGGGNMDPMPEGTSILAMPDETKWAEDRSQNEFLSIRWRVLKPEAYANRVVFQKLWVSDDDPRAKDPAKKKDKAKRMFAAIDANAGGKLGRKNAKPSDDELSLALISKQMVLRLGVWDMTGDDGKAMSGNYVQSVAPKEKPVSEVAAAPKKAPGRPTPFDEDDSDVPF